MVYFDTSFLAPLFLEESTSARIEQFVAGLSPGELAVSDWTRVEFSSLLAREVRMGGLDALVAKEIDDQFEAVVEESFIILLPDRDAFNLAKTFLQHYDDGLRAGDALHLAIAATHHAKMIFSLDKTMLKAGSSLGLSVSAGIAVE